MSGDPIICLRAPKLSLLGLLSSYYFQKITAKQVKKKRSREHTARVGAECSTGSLDEESWRTEVVLRWYLLQWLVAVARHAGEVGHHEAATATALDVPVGKVRAAGRLVEEATLPPIRRAAGRIHVVCPIQLDDVDEVLDPAPSLERHRARVAHAAHGLGSDGIVPRTAVAVAEVDRAVPVRDVLRAPDASDRHVREAHAEVLEVKVDALVATRRRRRLGVPGALPPLTGVTRGTLGSPLAAPPRIVRVIDGAGVTVVTSAAR